MMSLDLPPFIWSVVEILRVQFPRQVLYMLNFDNTAKRVHCRRLVVVYFSLQNVSYPRDCYKCSFLDSVFTKMLQRFPHNECLHAFI